MRRTRPWVFGIACAGLLWAQDEELATKSRKAKEAMTAGRYGEAARLYQELVRAIPDNPGIRLNLARAWYSAGEYARAIPQFEKALAAQPAMAPAWLLLGLAQQNPGAPDKAVGRLKKALGLDAGNQKARLELGDALLASGRASEAAEQFRTLAETDARSTKSWQGLASSYLALSREAFRKLDEQGAQSVWWCALMGRSRAGQQQYRSAFALYRRALALAPEPPGLHRAVAKIYEKTGHPDWAGAEAAREPALDCAAQPLECALREGRAHEVLTHSAGLPPAERYYWQARGPGAR